MPDLKISQLPVATTPLAGTELVPLVQGGVTVQSTVNNVLTGTVPSGTANGVLYLNGSKVVTSGSGLTFASNLLAAPNMQVSGVGNYLYFDTTSGAAANYIRTVNDFDMRLYCGRGSTSYTDITTDGIRWGIAASEQMRLNSTGLGIGTSSPGVKLDVQGSTPFARVKENSTGYLGFRAENNSGNFYFGIDSSTGGFYGSAYARVLYSDGAYPMVFYTNATERMRLDSSGNLGLGVTPSAWASYKALQVASIGGALSSSSSSDFEITTNAYYNGGWLSQGAGVASTRYRLLSGSHSWWTSGTSPGVAGSPISFTQAMTLDASGNLGIGTTSAIQSGKLSVDASGLNGVTCKVNDVLNPCFQSWSATTSGTALFVQFATEGSYTIRGQISYDRGAGLVAYQTTSDYRAKDIIGPVDNPGATIDALRVYEGQMKGATQSRPMLVAHEAQEVTPYAVTGEKDAVNDDGTPKYQQIDVSSLVPLLIAEIQSLRTRVAALEV